VAVSVNPRTVTIETNQLIRFLAYGRNRAGDSVHAPITWRATGGTILPDGRFSSVATGKFLVTGAVASTPGAVPGRGRDEDRKRVDTSIVQVVRRWPLLQSIEVNPEQVTLAPGGSQTFVAIGRLKDGRAVPVGTVWDADGGTIDAGGNFVAGNTAGTYKVIATNWTMLISDTAVVTITAPPAPEEPPAPGEPPVPPPAPIVEKLTLVPASATLAPAATRQFTAYGQTTGGDSVSVSVVFAATGGTVTGGGLYTAGATAGTYRIIATSGTVADTSTLTVTRPLGSGPGAGIPFGPSGDWGNTGLPFTLMHQPVTASSIVGVIDAARAKGVKLLLAMTGGKHGNYLSVINGVLQFDRAKWDAQMRTFDTPAIKAAIASGVADGTLLGAKVMDEPQVSGMGDGNTWGPVGTMTKLRVDSLCSSVKAIFPTLTVGVAHLHSAFEPTKSYRTCEFDITQYSSRIGSVTKYRDDALAMGRRDGIAILFSMNIVNGGTQAPRDGLWNCSPTTTGGRGTYDPNCRMTAQQVLDVGRVLGPAGCAMMMWRYDDAFMAHPENQQAFKDLGDFLRTLPGRSCSRS
jgi:hypothetical protein